MLSLLLLSIIMLLTVIVIVSIITIHFVLIIIVTVIIVIIIILRHETYLEAPGLFYLIMERCHGSLMDRLCDMPQLTESSLRSMFRQMLLGIGACHQAKIVHSSWVLSF